MSEWWSVKIFRFKMWIKRKLGMAEHFPYNDLVKEINLQLPDNMHCVFNEKACKFEIRPYEIKLVIKEV